MTRYFTTYWTAAPWEENAVRRVDHAASNVFASRGIDAGDHLYIVHFHAREVSLGARLVVERLATKREAADFLGVDESEIWDARDHVFADPEHVQRLDPNRVVPRDVLRDLVFLRADRTQTSLKFDDDGAANQQTLRTVRELAPSSAASLDALIDWDTAPRASQILTMRLSRGACYGECPVYELALSAEGLADWKGESYVDRVGHHVGEVNPDVVRELAVFAVSSGFFALEEDYPPPATDLPNFEIAIETGARDKVVRTWGGSEPGPFADLAKRLDQTAESIQWLSFAVDEAP